MKKRKRSSLRKSREAITREAERLVAAGVLQHPDRKVAKIGGRAPELITKLLASEKKDK